MSERQDPRLLHWYEEICCPVCGGRVNSWDKRISRAFVCEGCIAEEFGVTAEELRDVMKNHFGLVPCPGV